ncbi:putative prophage phiRv2 integrase [Streptomyces sulfonofaciens]|uniref:Prophage phiRv2 integrase n=1 Tax=Streptomyces sulfonofaciens TaxID=68272 RepID=A0A919KQT9_9ACTN|nr:site-specific integrase [Streptomyces sulfonofaciens]GHH68802.1 putative prophage phiRv2 integrase [Streptomyces sulfonofaciens]
MPNNKGRKRRFGAVRQLPSGRFQIRYPDPVTKQLRNGDRTYPTKRDAEVALSGIEADIDRGRWTDPDAGKVTLGDFIDRWFRERDYAATSRGRNEGVIRLHIRPYLGDLAVAEITTPRVRQWRRDLLDAGVGEATVVKAYQILRAAMNTAVDDGLIQRNPCRIKGAGITKSPERPVLTVEEVFAVAGAIEGRYRVLVLLAAFTGLRFGELAALQRRDIDVEGRFVHVRRAQAEPQSGKLEIKAPKSAAGVRTVSFPASLVPEISEHLRIFGADGRTGLLFVGPKGGRLRRNNFHDSWTAACRRAGVKGVHFHDLRHTGNSLAATGGATTRELMARMGHSTVRAAMIYQHLVGGRDREIADHVDGLIKKSQSKQGNRKSGPRPSTDPHPEVNNKIN